MRTKLVSSLESPAVPVTSTVPNPGRTCSGEQRWTISSLLWAVLIPFTNGSHSGVILSLRGHLAMSGDSLDVIAQEVLLASSGRRPRTLLNILWCTEHPTTKNYPAHAVNSAGAEKPRCTPVVSAATTPPILSP